MFKLLILMTILVCSGCASSLTKEPTKKGSEEFYAYIRSGGLLEESEKRMIERSVISRELLKRNKTNNGVPASKDKDFISHLNLEINKGYQKAADRQVKEMKQISHNLRNNKSTNWWRGTNNISTGNCHSVRAYTRKNGVRVRGHTRCR